MTTAELIAKLQEKDPEGKRDVIVMGLPEQGDILYEIEGIDPWTMEFGAGIRPEFIVLAVNIDEPRATFDIMANPKETPK